MSDNDLEQPSGAGLRPAKLYMQINDGERHPLTIVYIDDDGKVHPGSFIDALNAVAQEIADAVSDGDYDRWRAAEAQQ